MDEARYTVLSAALSEYTKRRWVVHPLSRPDDKGNSPGKRPLMHRWQFLTKTPDNIEGYVKKCCNIGLVCGSASGVDAIDLDIDLFRDELLNGFDLNTLTSGHRDGRGHLLFQHRGDIYSEKHHFIGVEYFGNNKEGAGSNLVLPPSVHYTGEVYTWKDPSAPLAKCPDKLKENLAVLFRKEDALHEYFKKCRRCFTKGSRGLDRSDPRSKGLWDRPDSIVTHGMDGRRAILAVMGELRYVGCSDELLHMACKRFFGKDYDFVHTDNELKHIESVPPKCETLRQYLDVSCAGCSWKPPPLEERRNMGLGESPAPPPEVAGATSALVSEGAAVQRYYFSVLDSARMVGELFPVGVQNLGGALCTTDHGWYKKALKAGVIESTGSPDGLIRCVVVVRGPVQTDPVFFDFETTDGQTIRMKDVEVFSYSKFRLRYFVACKKMPPPLSNAAWEKVIEALIHDSDDVTEAPDEEFIVSQVLNMVSRCEVVLEIGDMLKGSGLKAWRNLGSLWVSSAMINNITQEHKVTLRRIRQLLKPYLLGDAKQWRIGSGRYYLWPFDAGRIEGK